MAAQSALWLGIDLGTSSVKSAILDGKGRVRARARIALPLGNGERPAHDWVEAVQQSIAQLGDLRLGVAAVGLSGLTPTVVCVGARGKPVRDVMTWSDVRGEEEARALERRFGSSERLLGSDLPWSSTYPPAKLAWLRHHEPKVVGATAHVLQIKDFVGLQLTGSAVSDPWSSKGLCHILTGVPATPILAACDWPASVVPEIRPAWAARGRVTAAASDRFGLPRDIPVAVGWSDALSGFLALGAFQRPRAVIVLGTSNIVGRSLADPGPRVYPGLLSVPKPVAPLELLYGPTQSGGAAVAWVGQLLGLDPAQVLDRSRKAAGTVPTFVPYITGERSPVWNPDVRAAFSNVAADTGPAELCAAVLRGVAASACHVLDEIETVLGQPLGDTVTIGGYGADHPAWQQAFADQLGRPIETLGEDVSVLGAAMLAAAAAGCQLAELPRVRPVGPISPFDPEQGRSWHRDYLRLSLAALADAKAREEAGFGDLQSPGATVNSAPPEAGVDEVLGLDRAEGRSSKQR